MEDHAYGEYTNPVTLAETVVYPLTALPIALIYMFALTQVMHFPAHDNVVYYHESQGVLIVLGEKRIAFLNNLTTNDLAKGDIFETAFLTRLGKMIAYAVIVPVKSSLLLLVEKERLLPLKEYLQKAAKLVHLTVLDKTNEFSVISLFGPTKELLQKAQIEVIHGETHDGHIVILPQQDERGIKELRRYGAQEITADERELLRIIHGMPTWGKELNEQTFFTDLGMDHAVSYTKGCYVGQEIVARVKHLGKPSRLLRQLVIDDTKVPPAQTPIMADNAPIGFITSAAYSPCHRKVIALGFVQKGHYDTGTEVLVLGRKAIVRELPQTSLKSVD